MKRSANIFQLFIAFSILLSACGKDSSNNNNNNNNANATAHLQFVNASSTEQHPDLYLPGGSAPQISDFYYFLGSGYDLPKIANLTVTIKDGTHGTVLTSPVLALTKDSFYTWFLYDSFPNAKYILTQDHRPYNIPSGATTGMVKFINLSTNAGALSYRIKGSSNLVSNLPSAGTSTTACVSDFVPVPVGYQYIEVLDAATSQVIDSLPTSVFYSDAGKYYTIFTTGYRGATGQNMLTSFWTGDR